MSDERHSGETSRQASRSEYLAAELGHTVDHWGEPSGLERAMAGDDPEFRDLAVSLWRQAQMGRSLNAQLKEMEREGLTAADLWAPGVTETMPTASNTDEVRRYKKKLLFRANLLEALLMETVSELKRMDWIRPSDVTDASD